MYELLDENYIIYNDYDEKEGFRVRLQCMNPGKQSVELLIEDKKYNLLLGNIITNSIL